MKADAPSSSAPQTRDRNGGGGGGGRGGSSVDEGSDVTRSAPLPEKRLGARLLQAGNRAFTHVYHRLEVFAPCRLPKTGSAIIVCNHTSGLDPHLLQSPCRRLITWMMAKEYYDLWYLRPFFKTLGVIPVTRSGRDMAATREAMRALKDGQLLGIFPEGRIEKSREMFPFQTGVALMAMKTGVRVYPAYLDGTQRNKEMLPALLMPQRGKVIYGDEVIFDRSDTSREGLSAATDAIQHAVLSLQAQMDKLIARRGL